MSLVALSNRVRNLEQRQRARTQRIRMVGGATKAECDRPSDVIVSVNQGGVVCHTSARTAELLKEAERNARAKKPEAAPAENA